MRQYAQAELGSHAGVGAALMAAGADNLNLVGDSLAVGAAVFFFIGRRTGAGRVCALFGSTGHSSLLKCPKRLRT